MDLQRHIKILRIQLLCMARLSQRALDDSIKGYALGNADFCRHVRCVEHRLGEHHRQIKHLCRELATTRVIPLADSRFILAALRIDNALYRTYCVAAQMAQDTILFLKSSDGVTCVPLDRFGRLVNSLMRLCIIALFEKVVNHAEVVHESQRVWRRCELIFDHSMSDVYRGMDSEDIYALTITQNLGVIAKEAHEIADAILFWLNCTENGLASEADGYDVLNFLSLGCGKKIDTNRFLSLMR